MGDVDFWFSSGRLGQGALGEDKGGGGGAVPELVLKLALASRGALRRTLELLFGPMQSPVISIGLGN